MKMLQVQCALTVLVIVSVSSSGSKIEGYYWRDYYGFIPHDALPGGTDASGDPIYMGQVLRDRMLWPVKIYKNDNKAYFGYYGTEQTATEDVKILCTQSPERFSWISTKKEDIPLITNRHIIIGGSHPGKTMYFGRAFFGNETSVGRISTKSSPPREYYGLYISQNGKEIHFDSFEILVYDHVDIAETVTIK